MVLGVTESVVAFCVEPQEGGSELWRVEGTGPRNSRFTPPGGTGGVNLAFEQLAPDYLSEIKDQTCHNTLFGKGEFES